MKDATPLQPRWYSPKQVAELLGFGNGKIKTLIKSGDLKSIKDGKYRRILPEWVDAYVASKTAIANTCDEWEKAA